MYIIVPILCSKEGIISLIKKDNALCVGYSDTKRDKYEKN